MRSQSALTPQQKKVLFLSSLGGVLEFYDFIIYMFLAPYIEKIFFADNSAYLATLKTLAIFAVGYLARPLGGIIFSHFGDRYGRKVIFLMTVIFMALPSFIMGILPTTAQIGIAAPLTLVLLRLMQGMALGGEIPASITFVAEHVPASRKGFALSVLFFGVNLGLLLGSLVTSLMTSLLSEQTIFAYGWRIPFIIGGIFGVIAISLRRHLHETAAFTALRPQELETVPLIALLRDSRWEVLQGILLVSLGSVTVFLYLYWPQYLHQYFGFNLATMMRVNTAGTLVLNGMVLVGGYFVDRFGYRNVHMASALAVIVLVYPIFVMLSLQSIFLVMISYLIFSVLFGFIPGAYTAILSTLFPTSVRYTGIALSYNIAFAICGGFGPVICTLIIHYFHSALAPAFYMMAVAFLSLLACYFGRKSQQFSVHQWSSISPDYARETR